MPAPPTGSWDRRRSCYVAELGERYTDGRGRSRRRVVVLTYPDGTPVRRYDEAGRKEAIARLIRANAEADRRRCCWTVTDVFRAWIAWHAERGARPSSDRSRRDHCQRIANMPYGGGRLGDVPANEVREEHLYAISGRMRAEGVSEGYISTHQRTFLAAIRWAATAVEGRDPIRILATNPYPRDSVRIASPSRSRRACPTWPELLAILDRLDAWVAADRPGYGSLHRRYGKVNALWVRLIAERGCRPLEIAELRVEHWDREAQGFTLSAHKTARYGVAGVIPVRPSTVPRVEALIALPGRIGPWLVAPWRTEEQGPPKVKQLDRWWLDTRRRIGVHYHLYAFRNTVSNALRSAGVGDRDLLVALRHSTDTADTVYRRDDLGTAAEVFRRAGLD